MLGVEYLDTSQVQTTLLNRINFAMAPQIPTPDPGKLNGHWILDEMLNHIGAFHNDFPEIEFDILSGLLRDQIGHTNDTAEDSEAQTRAFLQAFQATPAFQDAFRKLDLAMKKRMHNFIAGRSAKDIVGDTDFRVPMSPQARQHLAPLDKFRAGMRRPFKEDLPVIYEDKAQSAVMEVSCAQGSPNRPSC
jgi:hypothetical protein